MGEGRFELAPGQGLLVFPDQSHHYGPFGDEPISWLLISFELADEYALLRLRDMPLLLSDKGLSRLDRLLYSYEAGLQGETSVGVESAYWLSLLLNDLLRQVGESPTEGTVENAQEPDWKRDMVRRVSRYVHRNLKGPIRVGDVAQHLALSESHLRRLFRRDLGVSLGGFIRRTRMHRASNLLHKSNLNITEIASTCGFSSLFAFSRAFRKQWGICPTAYRRKVRQASARRRPERRRSRAGTASVEGLEE